MSGPKLNDPTDLKELIMDRDSNNYNDLGEAVDSIWLLRIFPEELWLPIFEAVDDPNILVNCSLASSYFRTLLKPKSTLYQFQQVICVFSKPSLSLWFSCKDLLRLRMVCKTWKREIAVHIENLSRNENIQFSRGTTNPNKQYIYFNPFRSTILDTLESEIMPLLSSAFYQSNFPFPNRRLKLCDEDLVNSLGGERIVGRDPNLLPYYALIERFLEIAGHHVWYAHIACGFTIPTRDWYNMLIRWCRLMPNLKSLYIKSPYIWPQSLDILDLDSPFPSLTYLELLSFDNTPKSVTNIIMERNNHVKVLFVPKVCGPAPGTWFVLNEPRETLNFQSIQNLDKLFITHKTVEDFNNMPAAWNLTVLHLGFATGIRLEWARIFRKLEYFKDTLTELKLCLPRGATEPIKAQNLRLSSWSKLNLPKLKIFKVEIQDIFSLDFLLDLHSLEYLSIHMNCTEQHLFNTTEEVISRYPGFINRFGETNIWDVFASLQTITLNDNYSPEIKLRRNRH